MMIAWSHAGPSILAAFLASMVECVEALTVILAVGSVRGWRGALGGAAAALAVLFVIVVLLGATLARIPLAAMQVVVGGLLLLFGLRWLRKAILRAAGVLALRDERAAYARETERARTGGATAAWDRVALATSFQITLLEGIEVVFIVLAVSAGGSGLLIPAGLGALAALMLVVALGVVLHRPLAHVPENALKFAVGVLLSGFGTFWFGEGIGVTWPGGDWAALGLAAAFLAVAGMTLLSCCPTRTSRVLQRAGS